VATLDTIAIEDRHIPPFFEKIPIAIDRGEGVYVRDVTPIGRAHPAILAALTEQGTRLLSQPSMT
jgi:acetylornithine/N-succinyldiaminopimelate aminotransferase